MSKLTKEEIYLIKTAITENEQNEIVDSIKRKRGGEYPSDWYEVVIAGDLLVNPTITITSAKNN